MTNPKKNPVKGGKSPTLWTFGSKQQANFSDIIRGAILACFLGGFLALLSPLPAHNPADHNEIQHAINQSLAPGKTESLVDQAFSAEADEFLSRLHEAKSPGAMLEFAQSLKDARISEPIRERALKETAVELLMHGGPSAVPVLREWQDRPARVTYTTIDCRKPVEKPLFGYQAMAARAIFEIELREEVKSFHAQPAGKRLDWLLASARAERNSPRAAAAVGLISKLGESTIGSLLKALTQKPAISPAGGELIAEACLRLRTAPRESVFRRLPQPAARRLVEKAEQTWQGDARSEILRLTRERPDLASLGLFLSKDRLAESPREALERDGASAAAALAQDASREMTAKLTAIFSDPKAPPELKRRAGLALMMQNTDHARDAVRAHLPEAGLTASARQTLEEWLKR